MFGGQKLKRIVWNCKCDIIVRIGFHMGDTQFLLELTLNMSNLPQQTYIYQN